MYNSYAILPTFLTTARIFETKGGSGENIFCKNWRSSCPHLSRYNNKNFNCMVAMQCWHMVLYRIINMAIVCRKEIRSLVLCYAYSWTRIMDFASSWPLNLWGCSKAPTRSIKQVNDLKMPKDGLSLISIINKNNYIGLK